MTFHSVPKRALLLGLMAAALSTTAFTAPAFADKVLTMSVPGNAALDNLDPRVLLTTSHQAVQMAIFDSLVRSKGADIAPAAAEKWEISDDGKTYTFHLRDAKWSDGKPVTGQDFVDAFVRMFTTSPASSIYDAIQNRNYPVVQGGVFIVVLLFVATNLIVDLSYTWIDPRGRTRLLLPGEQVQK